MTEEAIATPAKITINQQYANLVPPLLVEKYESLKQSINQNDLWDPIVINSQGVIFDGHHRFKACQELGIKPKTVTKDFPDKLHEQMFVIDSNLRRRHLNNFQRTELALKSKSILEEIAKCNSRSNLKQQQQLHENVPTDRNLTVGSAGESAAHSMIGGRVDEQIAKKAGVSRDTVRKVEAIQEAAQQNPNLKYVVECARRGEMSVNEADQIIKTSEDDKQVHKARGRKSKPLLSKAETVPELTSQEKAYVQEVKDEFERDEWIDRGHVLEVCLELL
jgi:hypothetical protein